MKNKDWKKLQKKVNKIVRTVNKDIYNDKLWLGRFYIHQIKSFYFKFNDNSGGILQIWLEFRDRKTNRTKVEIFEFTNYERFLHYKISLAMNYFITEYIQVWKNEKPYENIIDYRRNKYVN